MWSFSSAMNPKIPDRNRENRKGCFSRIGTSIQNMFTISRVKVIPTTTPLDALSRIIISWEHASKVIDLIPTVTCVVDIEGNIKASNAAFKDEICATSHISSFLEVISIEDSDKFYKAFKEMSEGQYETFSGLFSTKSIEDNKKTILLYHWTVMLNPDKSFMIVSGKRIGSNRTSSVLVLPLHESNKKVSMKDSVIETMEGISTNMRDKTFNSSLNRGAFAKFMSFMSNVELKDMEIKEFELRAKMLSDTLETKRIFVRHVGHEIRTPLNVVSSGLELLTLQASSLDADLIETLQDTKSACKIAIDILNDLLTYEKLDSDILTLEKSPADVVELAQRVVSMFQIQARSSQIVMRLENKLPTEVAVSDVDSTKISQVIRNVISNALKFTPVGGRVAVTITVKDEGKRVRIDVQDSGVGMKKADRQRLFGEIVQFNPKELQNGQGSGMGLYLSRKIIDMHGGSIGVDLDWEGPGSIFFIELLTSEKPELNPLARKLSAQFNTFDPITGKQPSSELKMSEIVRSYSTAAGIRLLIVDDAVLCRKFHHRILSPSVQDIIEAGDGHEAVNIVKASLVNGHPIDGILIDSSMPFLNGPPAVKMIRELGYTGKIFGVTGNAYQSDIDDFLAHGVNEVLIKPLSIEKYGYVVQKVYQSVAAQEHNIVVVDN